MKTSIKQSSALSLLLIALFIMPTLGAFRNAQINSQGGQVTPLNGSTSDPMTYNVTLHGRGATFPAPLLLNWTSEYHSQNHNVAISYTLTGSGKGQAAFFNKTDDFDASDAPLQPIQRPLAPGVLHIPETIGSVTLSYNLPGAPQGLNITGAIIAEIYMGQILNWNDPQIQNLNPGFTLPNHSITTVHRFDGSGTTFVFTSFLSQDSSAWASSVGFGTSVNWPGSPTGSPPPIALSGSGNPGVASVIASTPYSFGYVELNYAIQNSFKYCKVQNPTGNYVLPSLQTTSYAVQNSTTILPSGAGDWSGVNMLNRPGAQTYPMASFTYLLVYQNLNVLPSMDTNETFQANTLINFLYWAVNNGGQQFAAGNYYVPLPTFVRQIDNASIASIKFTTQTPLTRAIHLSVGSTGWNGTQPGPSITIYSNDTVNLVLTSSDGLPHQFYIDYNNDGTLDGAESVTESVAFTGTNVPSTIHPAIGINVPSAGNFTYRDASNPANSGNIQIIQQQVAAVIPVPAALSSGLYKIDTSKATAVGTLVVNMRALTFSGNITEVAVDASSGSITFIKSYLVTNLQLHTVPNQAGVQDRFLLNAAVAPYQLSTIIVIQLVGTTPTITEQLTREVDIAANGFVSIIDVGIVFGHYGLSTYPQADLIAAGIVNIVSVSIVILDFGAPVYS